MFRIPDYVAKNGLDAGSQPSVRVDGTIGRNVTRLGVAFGAAGDRFADRQRRAAAEAARSEQTQTQTGPLSEDERRRIAHAQRRRAEAGAFQAERTYRDLQRKADEAETKARAAAGPSGEGFTALYERALHLLPETMFAGASANPASASPSSNDARPANGPQSGQPVRSGPEPVKSVQGEFIADMNVWLEADRERRLSKASAEEVRIRRDWTRAELGRMQGELLADLTKEPERFEEIFDQGVKLVVRNTLPDEEKAALFDVWQRQAQKALAGRLSETEDPQTLRVMFGFLPAGAPSLADADGDFGGAGSNAGAGADATASVNGNEAAGADRTGNSSPGDPASAPVPAAVNQASVDLEDIIFHPAFLTGDDETLRRELNLAEPAPQFAGFAVADGIAATQAAQKRQAAEHDRAAVDLAIEIRQNTNLLATTGKGLEGLTYERVKAGRGKAFADKWQKDQLVIQKSHKARSGISGLDATGLKKHLFNHQPAPHKGDMDVQRRVFEQLETAIQAHNELRADDPAASVRDRPAVQSAYQAFDPANAPASWQRIIEANFQQQDKTGIHNHRRTPFERADLEILAAPILRINGQDRQAAIDTLTAGLIESYGAYADEVLAALIPFWRSDPELTRYGIGAFEALKTMVGADQTLLTQDIRRRVRELSRDNNPLAGWSAPSFGETFAHAERIRRAHVALVRQAAAADPSLPTAFAGYSDAELARLYGYIDRVRDEPKLSLSRDYLQKGVPTPGASAIRYLRDHPDTLPHFIETFGADQVPAGLDNTPRAGAGPITRAPDNDGRGAVNPYPLFVRAQLALATEIGANDRFGLNNARAFAGTLAGAGEAALTVDDSDRLPPGHPEATFGRGRIIAFTEEVAGMIRDAEGFGESLAGLGGSLAGSSSSPEAVAGPLRLLGPGRTAVSRVGNAALTGALAEGTADPMIQALRIRAGLQDDYEPGQTVNAILFGAAVPPALEGLAQVYRGARAVVGQKLGPNMPNVRRIENNDVQLYNLPELPQRPFAADYPDGAATDELGRLIADSEGRRLEGRFVAGRRVRGGADEAIPAEEFDSIAEAATGNKTTHRSLEVFGETDLESGTRKAYQVTLDDRLSPADEAKVYGHELGHVIDQAVGEIPIDDLVGPKGELGRLYSYLNSGRDDLNPLFEPKHRGYNAYEAPRELMAEAIRAYMNNPNALKTIAPKTAKRIRAYVNNHPNIRKIIQFNSIAAAGAAAVGSGLSGRDSEGSAAPDHAGL